MFAGEHYAFINPRDVKRMSACVDCFRLTMAGQSRREVSSTQPLMRRPATDDHATAGYAANVPEPPLQKPGGQERRPPAPNGSSAARRLQVREWWDKGAAEV